MSTDSFGNPWPFAVQRHSPQRLSDETLRVYAGLPDSADEPDVRDMARELLTLRARVADTPTCQGCMATAAGTGVSPGALPKPDALQASVVLTPGATSGGGTGGASLLNANEWADLARRAEAAVVRLRDAVADTPENVERVAEAIAHYDMQSTDSRWSAMARAALAAMAGRGD